VASALAIAPRRVLALGLTYRDHIAETGERVGDEGPVAFERDPASLLREGDVLWVPSPTAILQALERLEPGLGMAVRARHPEVPALLDYEVELGLLLLADVPAARLEDPSFRPPVSAFLANDVTVRTVQILGEGSADRLAFWAASKSFAGTLLVGPTSWAPPDGGFDVPLSTAVNGVVRQRSSTRELLYTPRELLRFAARASGGRTLDAGDVVLTGTPGGIALSVARWKRMLADRLLSRFGKLSAAVRGSRRRGSRFLRDGDVLEMDGGPLGRLRVAVKERER
jgi:2-keto-4-pentenoate hydratase/2-oxohepta-3-ene-1,7-dioic acid hydratase in catechol pathway